MINQTQWRSYSLAASSIGISIAVVYAFFVPSAGKRQVAAFQFPQRFAKAQAIATTPHQASEETAPEVIQARQQYKYTQTRPGMPSANSVIALEINYLVGTRGDVVTYLENYTDISAEVIKAKSIKYIEGIGHYALLKDQDQAYITSCISPHSLSNVTQKQFSQYRYQQDLTWQTAWKWLQGEASIRDRRCLWVLLSTPVTANNTQNDQALENAWKEIYQWWLPNFPVLVNSKSHELES
ncbi:MAG: cyanoexosortase A system-associated protein [Cyanobacteria bacterium J06631_2]